MSAPGESRMILKSETYHFHRLDLTRQAGFIVTIYDYCGDRWTQPVGLVYIRLAASRATSSDGQR